MAEYTTINVDAGDTYRKSLSNGETWKNVLIDISASGASLRVDARGSNMTIRNVAISGQYDSSQDTYYFGVEADAGSTVRIENVYMADPPVAGHDPPPSANPTGIYVYWTHAGTIEIDRCNIQNCPDNGIYGSPPGNPSEHPNPGGNGEVHVTNCYTAHNDTANVRLGSDGSYAENCMLYNGDHRGFWGYYNDTEVVDCDIMNAGASDIDVGGSSWSNQPDATVTATNSRFETVDLSTSTNELHGSSDGDPVHRSPEDIGVPTTAEEAASGEFDNGTDPDPEPRDEPTGFYETFPDGSAALDRYNDSTSEYTVEGTNTLIGDYALAPASSGHARIITPEDGPGRGSQFGLSCYPSADDVGIFMFHFAATQSGDGWQRYALKADHENGQLQFGRFGPGGEGWIETDTFDTTGTGGQWNDLLVDFGDTDAGTISYEYAVREDQA